ncbi:hypothetical protein [Marinomonas sp. 2405UD68-3]|uniref:2OG-Fe(II)-dependent halogenase WelO5 family protein n=1 Tax=Marinomonas sp. 2405UD68-3 TaxID=3391835 RepID=UPI0039C9A869
MTNWIKNKLCDLTSDNLKLLLDHKIPGIIIKNFIPLDTCEEVSKALKNIDFGSYSHLKKIPVYNLGVCHSQYADKDKKFYFNERDNALEVFKDVFKKVDIDPVDMVINELSKFTVNAVRIFNEKNYGNYFAGTFRSFKGHGKLHVDYAPIHIGSAWAVSEVIKQLSWNIYYLTYLEGGGEVIIYDTVHSENSENYKNEGDYFYQYDVLNNSNFLKITPEVGDLILFNSQNFHEVKGHSGSDRFSQSSFIGLKKDGSLNLWS